MLVPALVEDEDVLIDRCHPGYCHYPNGNYQVQRWVDALKKNLKAEGMDENQA